MKKQLRRLWETALELIYPTRAQCLGCGDARGCDEPFLCNDCLRLYRPVNRLIRGAKVSRLGLSGVAYVHNYGRPVRGLIHAYKYQSVKMLAPFFGKELARLLKEKKLDSFDVIIPVPLHKSKLRQRGYNQAELAANELSRHCGIPVRAELLARVRNTRQQARLSIRQRRENTRDAFKAGEGVKGLHILLLDDVITTGSTASSCARALLKAGAEEVQLIAIAGARRCARLNQPRRYRRASSAKSELTSGQSLISSTQSGEKV